MSLVEEVI